MIGLILCGLAFGVTYLLARRSPVLGIAAVIGVGYFYGIVRANVLSTFTYFIFDAAILGLYLTLPWARYRSYLDQMRTRELVAWMAVLIGWPLLLLLVPMQDPLVRLVGLRAHIFLLPFLLLGSQLRREGVDQLATSLAVLNLVALAFAVGELVLGVERFYPRNQITEIIYRSTDVATVGMLGLFRIPATFANASSYGAMMTITVPLLLGAWVQRDASMLRRWLLTAGLAAAVLGVFLSASRTHMVILLLLLLVSLVSGKMGAAGRATWVVMLAGLSWVVMTNERLVSRLLTLSPDAIVRRISISVNESFLYLLFDYPLGNGLGGGGSSMPGFLEHLVRRPVMMENQYTMIMLEQGVPGLILFLLFLAWVFTRRTTHPRDRWQLGRRLAWWTGVTYFAHAAIGVGVLTAVPFSVVLLLLTGWIAVPPAPSDPEREAPPKGGRPRPGREADSEEPVPAGV